MGTSDFFNLTLAESDQNVDLINKKFYGRYNYPWAPSIIQSYPANVAVSFLNQDIGSWSLDRIPQKPRIWVAGCGTNQALLTALKFPDADVFGTDISTQSLEACRKNAQKIGVSNLHLEEKSLNDIVYEEEFDYIICTGVVHHNARPDITLNRISRALKKNGVLEFMVYNYYHRLLSTACQKAIRTFYDASASVDLDLELKLIRNLLSDFQYNNLMGDFLRGHIGMHEAEMADRLVQPVEYSYNIESLNKLTDSCNLDILFHCQNQFDVTNNAFSWNMNFKNYYLKDYYNSLPDVSRWQISNLLLFNNSPMLWFYFQRKDSDFERKTEAQLCADFLDTSFRKSSILLRNYILEEDGSYKSIETPVKYPADNTIEDPGVRRIFDAVNPAHKMKDIFYQCGIKMDFYEINKIRVKLCTSGYPYLLAN
ncbi:MAG: methyltransferase domain-containing protein [Bacteroidota bacterium]